MRQIIPLFSHLNQAVCFSKGNAPLCKLFQNHLSNQNVTIKLALQSFFSLFAEK